MKAHHNEHHSNVGWTETAMKAIRQLPALPGGTRYTLRSAHPRQGRTPGHEIKSVTENLPAKSSSGPSSDFYPTLKG